MPLVGVLLGLGSALCWGSADFGGGLLSRGLPATTVVIGTQTAGLLLALTAVVLINPGPPLPSDLLAAAVAGVAGVIAVMALYRALSIGQMGRVAPIAALTGVSVPLAFDWVANGLPELPKLAGLGLAVLSIFVLAVGRSSGVSKGAIPLAVVAGLGIACFYVAFGQVREAATLWGTAAHKAVGVSLLGLVAVGQRGQISVPVKTIPAVVLVGVLDTIGSILFLLAVSAGRLGEASVLASLYVGVTVALAWVVLAERLRVHQALGVASAAVGIVLIALPT